MTSVNDALAGTSGSVTTNEDNAYTFGASDFGFTDPNDSPADTLLAVKISTLPGAGSLKDNGDVNVTKAGGTSAPMRLTLTTSEDADGSLESRFPRTAS